MNNKNHKIYIVAGESSGDFLGSSLIQSLDNLSNQSVDFFGIGGSLMENGNNFRSLFPMSELSLMGLFEIIPHIFHLKKRINQTVQHILTTKPDALIFIDSPGFCKRVIKKIKAYSLDVPIFYYVAPSVWAWRPKRAKKLAELVDHLFCLFPFEPNYFIKEGLDATFVGHPLTEIADDLYPKDSNKILILPGSRKSEINNLLPIFLKVANNIKQDLTEFYLPTPPHLKEYVESFIKESSVKVNVIVDQLEKNQIFKTSSLAIAASGTVSLELAKYKIPHVIAYKVHPLTAFIGRFLIKIPYFALPNIIAQKEIVPECMQERCTVKDITNAFSQLKSLNSEELHNAYQQVVCPVKESTPSLLCAKIVYEKIKTKDKN